MRRLLGVVLFVVAVGSACRDLGGKDGGTDAGVGSGTVDDGGAADAGPVDGGAVSDAGTDAGLDAGALDGGGAGDAGSDAGLDAGPLDGGGADGGSPDGAVPLPVAQLSDGGTAVYFAPMGSPPGGFVREFPWDAGVRSFPWDGGGFAPYVAWEVRVPDGGAGFGFMTGVQFPLDGGPRLETLGHFKLHLADGGVRRLPTSVFGGEPGDGTQAGVASTDVDESGVLTLENERSAFGPMLHFDRDASSDFFWRPADAGFSGRLSFPTPGPQPTFRREATTWRLNNFGGLDGGPRHDGGFVWDGGLTDGGFPNVPVDFFCVGPGSGTTVELARREGDTAGGPAQPPHDTAVSYTGICGPRLALPPPPQMSSGKHPYEKLLIAWLAAGSSLPVCRLCTAAVLNNPALASAFPGLRPLPAFDPANVHGELITSCDPCRVGQVATATVRVTTTDPNAIVVLRGAQFSAHDVVALTPPVQTTLVPGDITAAQAAIGSVGFTCTKRGTAEVSAHVFGRVALTASKNVRCERTGLHRGKDALLLADVTRIVKNGAGWTVMGTGVTANVISPTAAVDSRFSPVTNDSVLYDAVSAFDSLQGLSPLTLRSSRQTATATFSGTRYNVTGLVGQPAFAATDTFTVQAMSMGSPVSVSVPAPPALPAPAQLFGPRAGYRTEVRLPDGSFDTLYTFVVGTTPRGGFAGLNRLVDTAALPLVSGNRVAPILSDDDVEVLTTWGLTVTSVYVAGLNEVDGSTFFAGTGAEVPLQAGRMYQATPADFAP